MRHVGQHRYRHRRLPSMRRVVTRVASIGIGAASAASINAALRPASVSASSTSINAARGQHRHRSGIGGVHQCGTWASIGSSMRAVPGRRCHRPAQRAPSSPSRSVRWRRVQVPPIPGDVAAAAPGAGGVRDRIRARARSRSPAPATRPWGRAALRRRSLSSAQAPGDRHGSRAPRATRGHMQGSTGAPGAYPRARSVEVTRARYPIPGPRRTSPPFPLVRTGARGSPRLTGAARNARAHAGQPWSARLGSPHGHPFLQVTNVLSPSFSL